MKEGITYSFLLNIIILFVFVCAAIVTGIFSYYRAFKAGTTIVNEIEKYEGYNCVSAEAISEKLNGIGYSLPFKIECGSNETNCIISNDGNYKVVSFNYNDKVNSLEKIDYYSEMIYYDLSGNSDIDSISKYKGSDFYCGEENGTKKCFFTAKYGYGIYTYMYTELPVVSKFLKIPIYFKTKRMIEQRNLTVGNGFVYDFDIVPKLYWLSETTPDAIFKDFAEKTQEYYVDRMVAHRKDAGYLLNVYGYGVRKNSDIYNPDETLTLSSIYKLDLRDLFRWANSSNSSGNYSSIIVDNRTTLQLHYKNACGYQVDWSLY